MERDKENLVTQSGHTSPIEFVWQWGIAWLLQSDRNGKPCDFFFGTTPYSPFHQVSIHGRYGIPMAVATSSHRRHFDLKTSLHKELFGLMTHIVTGDQAWSRNFEISRSASHIHPEFLGEFFHEVRLVIGHLVLSEVTKSKPNPEILPMQRGSLRRHLRLSKCSSLRREVAEILNSCDSPGCRRYYTIAAGS